MHRHVPNLLTGLRLVLAVVFFAMLAYYQHDVGTRHADLLWLNIALAVYLVAVFTDFLDGFLARRWRVEGVFGRVVDPFVDKVLVIGSFIFFAGKNFIIPAADIDPGQIPDNVRTITGVVPWMVVVILARELLVTSLRGISEAEGKSFGAAWPGKVKMVLQSVAIFVILVFVNYHVWLKRHGYDQWAPWFERLRDVVIWATVLVTVYSGLSYVRRARVLFARPLPTD